MRKAITNEELMHLVDEYAFDHPGQRIKIPSFGKYVRNKGFDVEDHTIRRYKDCREYIDRINNKTSETAENELVTYKTIDADAFIDANKSRSALKKALIERDSYYSRIASNAVNAINEKKTLERKCEEKDVKIADLNAEIERLRSKAGDNRIQNVTIKKMKRVLDEYVYPDIANIILEKEGLFESGDTIIPKDKISLISANTVVKNDNEEISVAEVKISEFGTINRLAAGFGKG